MFLCAAWSKSVRYGVFVRCVVEAVRNGVFIRSAVEVVRYGSFLFAVW